MDSSNDLHDQSTLWNGPSGRAWVDAQPLLDALFRPIADKLVEAVRSAGAADVLDVGCGTGATSLAIARLEGVRCTGIDLSEPMIALARRRAAHEGLKVTFIAADAERWDFAPAAFDMIVSRFGLMFFDDPVAAFANFRRCARDGAELHFYAWRSVAENPFMTTAERAAAPLLPELPPRQPGAPGQFAFADTDRVGQILAQSGWGAVEIEAADFDCAMTEADLAFYITRLGPLGTFLATTDEEKRDQVLAKVLPAFDPFVREGKVRFTAACWRVKARSLRATESGSQSRQIPTPLA